MVASLLLWNSSMENKVEESKWITENKGLEERITKVETTKSRGRKSSKTSQKKLPQRGLGVAQLERLRLQERLKKMPEVDQVKIAQNLYPRFQFFPFLDPKNEVLDSFARFAPVNYGQPSSHLQSFGFQPYNGFAGGVTGCSGGNSLFPGQFQVDRLRITSQELSSTQNIYCLSDRCDICLKVRIRVSEQNIFFLPFNGGTTQYTEKMMLIDCDFLGLNLGRNSNLDGFKGVRRACHSGLTVDEEVEAVAVHRKGKSVGGSSVLMEYEFFPHKGGSSSSFNNESSITEAGGAAYAAIMAMDIYFEFAWASSTC